MRNRSKGTLRIRAFLPRRQTERAPLERQEADWKGSPFRGLGSEEIQGRRGEAQQVREDACVAASEDGHDRRPQRARASGRSVVSAQGVVLMLPRSSLMRLLRWVLEKIEKYCWVFVLFHGSSDLGFDWLFSLISLIAYWG